MSGTLSPASLDSVPTILCLLNGRCTPTCRITNRSCSSCNSGTPVQFRFVRPSVGAWTSRTAWVPRESKPSRRFMVINPELAGRWSPELLVQRVPARPSIKACLPIRQQVGRRQVRREVEASDDIANSRFTPELQAGSDSTWCRNMNRELHWSGIAKTHNGIGRSDHRIRTNWPSRMQREAVPTPDGRWSDETESHASSEYGIGEKPTDDFGRQSCLMARRLAEAWCAVHRGLTHVSNWDQHGGLA